MKVVTTGTREALRNLRRELAANVVHVGGWLAAALGPRLGELQLHLGCGRRRLEGWVNVDLRRGADVRIDLREPLPFATGSAARVFAEHFLEHLDYPGHATGFLRECYRVLRPGGRLRLGVPDTGMVLDAYARGGDDEYFRLAKERWHPGWVVTPLEHVNFHFRDRLNEHRWAYDEASLHNLLHTIGFGDAHRSAFCTETDSDDRRLGTLYVEAVR